MLDSNFWWLWTRVTKDESNHLRTWEITINIPTALPWKNVFQDFFKALGQHILCQLYVHVCPESRDCLLHFKFYTFPFISAVSLTSKGLCSDKVLRKDNQYLKFSSTSKIINSLKQIGSLLSLILFIFQNT